MFKKKNPYQSVKVQRYEAFAGTHENSEVFKLFAASNERVIHKWVHYFDIYDRYFKRYRGKPVTILEIGVYKGGSLKLWKNYFGPQAKIYGVDIDPECKNYEEDNVQVFIGDQSDCAFLKELVSKLPQFDIVLDDGGHTSKQQITSFEELYGHVAHDGIYMVEDTQTNYWKSYNKGARLSFIEYSKKLVDKLHEWHFDKSIRGRFGLPYKDRIGKIKVSDFTRATKAVHFYNSVVVFEKEPQAEPYHCYSNTPKKAK